MRIVKKPSMQVGEVFTACVNGYSHQSTQDRKARLTAVKPAIEQVALDFDLKAQSIALHAIPQAASVSYGGVSVDKEEMKDLYNDKLAHAGASGRAYYDVIKAGARICPLCGHGIVWTVDHHLPKAQYPALAVTPMNLLPSCRDCNTNKKITHPRSPSEHTFHPYYDDFFIKEPWLYAEVVKGPAPSLVFTVKPPSGWDAIKTARANSHLDAFGLRELYSENAGSLLSGIWFRLERENETGGEAGIHQYLQDAAESHEAAHTNSWQLATYRGLDRSDWFCTTGFRLIANV